MSNNIPNKNMRQALLTDSYGSCFGHLSNFFVQLHDLADPRFGEFGCIFHACSGFSRVYFLVNVHITLISQLVICLRALASPALDRHRSIRRMQGEEGKNGMATCFS